MTKLLALVLLFCLLSCSDTGGYYLQPPQIMGGPLRVDDASGDRVYLLTSQWIKRKSIGYRQRTRDITWMHLDLWAFDAASAQPVYRSRLAKRRIHGDAATLGVDNGVLWLRLPELVGVRLADGVIVADAARIEARNPALAGMLPAPTPPGMFQTQAGQPFKFDRDGLNLVLADACRVRIDAASLQAMPVAAVANAAAKPDPTPPRQRVRVLPVREDGMPVRRGVVTAGAWLGLLADSELPVLVASEAINRQMDWSQPLRHRLYRAELHRVQEFLGPRDALRKPVPLPDSPEFVMAGLLVGDDPEQALWRRDPDSVYVLSRDRIGRDGHLQLARIAGPAGRVVWSQPLPLSKAQFWLPGERHGVMLGVDATAPRSALAIEGEDSATQLVAIDIDRGDVHAFSFDAQRGWPATDQPTPESH